MCLKLLAAEPPRNPIPSWKDFLVMVIFINGKKFTVFNGATLLDAVRAYSLISSKRLVSGYLAVYDRFGFRTEPDGPAVEGGHYFLRIAGKRKI